MIKAALIGVSGYGKVIYDMCQPSIKNGKMEMSAMVIRTPSKVPDVMKALEGSSCQIFSSADEMFEVMNGKLDLVLIPTGIETHASLSIAAMRSGAHVMVEKPAAGSVSEVEEMQKVSLETGKIVSVGFQDLYRPDILDIKRNLVSEKWGALQGISVLGSWSRSKQYYTRNDWAGKEKNGDAPVYDSPANNAFAHYLNLGLFLLGEDFAVSAEIKNLEADCRRAHEIETFDTIVARAMTDRGQYFRYAVTHVGEQEFEPELMLQFDIGVLHMRHDENVICDGEGRVLERLRHDDVWAGRDRLIPMVLEAIRHGDAFYCDLEIAKAHTKFVERVHETSLAVDFEDELISKEHRDGEDFLKVNALVSTMKLASSEGSNLDLLKTPLKVSQSIST
jgi:predicted dehydrogenase